MENRVVQLKRTTGVSEIPGILAFHQQFRKRSIESMSWEEVQKGLEAAKKAGRREAQPLKPLPD